MASSQTQRQTNRREATMAVPRIGCFRLSPARGTQGGGTKLQVVKEGSFWFNSVLKGKKGKINCTIFKILEIIA